MKKVVHVLNSGVEEKEKQAFQKKWKHVLPKAYLNFLRYWNGGLLAGKITLFSMKELAEKNPMNEEELFALNIGQIGKGYDVRVQINVDENKLSCWISQDGRTCKSSKSLDALLDFVIKSYA